MNKKSLHDLHNIILEKIKTEDIRPIPRWKFILLNVVMWVLIVLAIFLGSLAFGVVLDVLFGAEWSILDKVMKGSFQGFLMVLPYLWILILILAFIAAWKVFLYTRQGYRYAPHKIILVVLLASVLGGVVLWQTRISHHADRWATENLPPQMQLEQGIKNQIFGPKEGMLDGFVIEEREDVVILKGMFGDMWVVDIVQIDQLPQQKHVLFLGKKTGEFEFIAEEVLTPRGIMPDEFRSKNLKEKNQD